MGTTQASQYSSRSLLAWNQSVIGIYHVRNPSEIKTKEHTSTQVSLWAAKLQCLQFTDLLVCSHVILGPAFKYWRQLTKCCKDKRSTIWSAVTVVFCICMSWDYVRDKGAGWWLNLLRVFRQAMTASNAMVRHLIALVFVQEVLTNKSSITLVTKRKQFVGTHLYGTDTWRQIQYEMHTFTKCHGLNLRNISAETFPSQQEPTSVCGLWAPVTGLGAIMSSTEGKQSQGPKQANAAISSSNTGNSLRSWVGKSIDVDKIIWLLIFNFLHGKTNFYLAVNMSVTNITNQINFWD